MKKTYQEAEREAKLQCITSGGCSRIITKNGKWYDTETEKYLTEEEGLALVKVEPEYVRELMK